MSLAQTEINPLAEILNLVEPFNRKADIASIRLRDLEDRLAESGIGMEIGIILASGLNFTYSKQSGKWSLHIAEFKALEAPRAYRIEAAACIEELLQALKLRVKKETA